MDHLAGSGSGDIPGSSGSRSRAGQGMDTPHISIMGGAGTSGKIPRSVSGVRSYGIRHAAVAKVAAVSPGAKVDTVAKIPKAPSAPKLGNQL